MKSSSNYFIEISDESCLLVLANERSLRREIRMSQQMGIFIYLFIFNERNKMGTKVKTVRVPRVPRCLF